MKHGRLISEEEQLLREAEMGDARAAGEPDPEDVASIRIGLREGRDRELLVRCYGLDAVKRQERFLAQASLERQSVKIAAASQG